MSPLPGRPYGSMANSTNPNMLTQALHAAQQGLFHYFTESSDSYGRPFIQHYRRFESSSAVETVHVVEVSLSPGAHAGVIIASVIAVLANIAILIWCTRLSFRVRPVERSARNAHKRDRRHGTLPALTHDRLRSTSALFCAADRETVAAALNHPRPPNRPATPSMRAPAITCTAPTPPGRETEENDLEAQVAASETPAQQTAEKDFLKVPDQVRPTRRAPEAMEPKRMLRAAMPGGGDKDMRAGSRQRYQPLPQGWFIHDTKAEDARVKSADGEELSREEVRQPPAKGDKVGRSSGGRRERYMSGAGGLDPAMRDSGVQLAEADKKRLRMSGAYDIAG